MHSSIAANAQRLCGHIDHQGRMQYAQSDLTTITWLLTTADILSRMSLSFNQDHKHVAICRKTDKELTTRPQPDSGSPKGTCQTPSRYRRLISHTAENDI